VTHAQTLLYTTPEHVGAVSVGSTATVVSGTVTARTGAATVNSCGSSSLVLRIDDNTPSGVVGSIISGTFTNCALSAAGDFPWKVNVSGSGTVSGTSRIFTNASWSSVSATLWGVSPGNGTLTGATGSPPTDGVYVRQVASTGDSLCFVLDNAGTLSGPLLSDGKIDATYCLDGSASAWSLAPSFVTLYTNASHTTRVSVGATASLALTSTLGFTSGTALVQLCPTSTLNFVLSQNTSTQVQGTLTGGSLNCFTPVAPTFPWTVTITNGKVLSGSTVAWPGATLSNLRYDILGAVASGTITPASASSLTGLYATQSTAAGAPVCLVFNHAGSVSDPFLGNDNLDGQYCFEGSTAGTWSLT